MLSATWPGGELAVFLVVHLDAEYAIGVPGV